MSKWLGILFYSVFLLIMCYLIYKQIPTLLDGAGAKGYVVLVIRSLVVIAFLNGIIRLLKNDQVRREDR